FNAHLFCADDLIHTFELSPTTAATTYSEIVTPATAATVSNYSDLRIRFEANFQAGNPLGLRVSQAFLTMDDASTGTGAFTYEPVIEQCRARPYDYPYSHVVGKSREAILEVIDSPKPADRMLMGAQPQSLQDARNGRICSVTGVWYPGSQ